MSKLPYNPDRVSPPGATLESLLSASSMSQAELSERMGRPKKFINEIIRGKATITAETALQLEAVLGVAASFWTNREARYQEFLARQEQKNALQHYTKWISHFPLKEMARCGAVHLTHDSVTDVQAILRYFGVASPDQWQDIWQGRQAAFRRSAAFHADWYATTAWLRFGEIAAESLDCNAIDIPLFKEALVQTRTMTGHSPTEFLPLLQRTCAKAGVAVIVTPEFPRTHVSGATQWLSPRKALIQLTFRYKTNDQFWFTFFHEVAHILLHGKKELFIDTEAESSNSRVEQEADTFSRNFLIPQPEWEAFIGRGGINAFRIREFSGRIGIHPGIVVGRLQREKILEYSALNSMKARYSGDFGA